MRSYGKDAVLVGVGLTVAYTVFITGADAITKSFSAVYAAPHMFALSGGLVALFCLVAGARRNTVDAVLKTACPRAMAVRAFATVIGTCAFFYAFKFLPFAEVFLFIAFIPILSAAFSRTVLQERLDAKVWGALCLGVIGMAFLFPGGWRSLEPGHLIALIAVVAGAISMVASRFIGQRDPSRLLSQVFYPNVALMCTMALALPFVFSPMTMADFGLVAIYAVLLFIARWVLVASLRILPAYVVTPLMNLQFLWMVLVGIAVFGERPGTGVVIGAGLLITASCWLVMGHMRVDRPKTVVPAE